MVHFIEQGDDTFYVTGYDENGFECGGYNVVRTRPSRIMTRVWPYADYPQMLPTDFLAGINQNDPLSIRANGRNYNVRFARVELGAGTGWKQRCLSCSLNTDLTADERMHHKCLWPGHSEHFGERNNTFYRRFSSTLDKQRLAIKASFLANHPMHQHRKVLVKHQGIEYEMKMKMDYHKEKPERTNHVGIYGKWK
ncbi:hypothetical protein Tco_0678183 [Tanacetum coccineum]|uniref:Uncharacterized protein n=1 Tax=Tanacetum coccineum TaxID=301880 RepID=A0ABQ4XE94_9ASTR